eukprot:1136333-Pelagomonas_calceolata.AAC.5
MHGLRCAPCKLLLPFIAYSLSLANQQQTIHQRLLHPHIKGRVAGPAPHRTSKLPCLHLSTRGAHHTIIRTFNIWLSGKRERPPDRANPKPRTQQEHPSKYAEAVCVDWSCSRGLRWPGRDSHQKLADPVTFFAWQACQAAGRMVGWLAQAKNCLQDSLQRFSRAPATASHAFLTLQCRLNVFGWEASQSFRARGELVRPGWQL